MKKVFMLLLISLVFFTGCDIKQVDNKNINEMIDLILDKNLNLYNQTSSGYKYYMPRGMRLIDNTDYNEKLYSDNYTYYLYVDIVSYNYAKTSNYTENEEAYFSKELNIRDKKGYLEINQFKNVYFIEMFYNYAKIEVYVAKDDIEAAVINASYILGSLKFNDKIVKIIFEENAQNFDEEEFELFEPKRTEGNFLDYVNEFEQYDEEEIDEDLIVPSTTEDTIDTSLE